MRLFELYLQQIRALHSYNKMGLNHTQNWPIRDKRFRDKLCKDKNIHSLTACCDRINKQPRRHQDNTVYIFVYSHT